MVRVGCTASILGILATNGFAALVTLLLIYAIAMGDRDK